MTVTTATPLIEQSQQAVLEDQVERFTANLTNVRESGDADAIRYWQAEVNAASKALYWWLRGVRPVHASAFWLVPSSEQNGTIYQVSSTGCTCQAGVNGKTCWHAAMATAADLGIDNVEMVDDYTDDDRERALADMAELFA